MDSDMSLLNKRPNDRTQSIGVVLTKNPPMIKLEKKIELRE